MKYSKVDKKLSMIYQTLLIFVFSFLLMKNPYAQEMNSDPQVKIIDFKPNQIITLVGTHFIATSIQFAKNEKIVGVYLGDQVAWTYAMSPSTPYLFFLKPTLDVSDTNMTVITSQHIYHFHLLSNKNTESKDTAVYSLQFRYDAEKKTKLQSREKIRKLAKKSQLVNSTHAIQNINYTLKGSHSLFPECVYDDGKFTYFEFPHNSDFPVIFVLNSAKEKLINTQIQRNTVIAKCIAKTFLLVKNDEKVWVENKNDQGMPS